MESVTVRTLRDAGREDTVLGQVALILACRLDSPSTDTGSSVASVVREYRSTMAAALEGYRSEMDPLQRLRGQYNLQRVASGFAPVEYRD